MSIYTKKGDRGQTGLPGDRRLAKTDQLFETLGTFDQTSALIGLAVSMLDAKNKVLAKDFQDIQSTFLSLGACLASERSVTEPILNELPAKTAELEARIDRWDELLPPLRNFILAGGTPAAAALHTARVSVRAAERHYHRLPAELIFTSMSQYLNRLSDYFFQAARFINHQAGTSDITWRS